MRQFLLATLFLAIPFALMAQDDINLLDLVNEPSATRFASDTVSTSPEDSHSSTQASSASQSDTYDWRKYRSSLSVTAGSPSLLSGTTGIMFAVKDAFNEPNNHTYIAGTYGIHYGYNALKWLRVGGGISYGHFKTEATYMKKRHVERYDELILLAKVDFTYLNRRYVRLYSGVGAGVDFTFMSKTVDGKRLSEDEAGKFFQALPAWTFTALGVEAGGKRVYGIAEVNIGFTDLLRVGLGVRF